MKMISSQWVSIQTDLRRALHNSQEQALPGVGKDARGRADEIRMTCLPGGQGHDPDGRVGQGDAIFHG
jgi:hypothetical protein